MVRKSSTKVCNYSAHLVKGHNPYCSRRTISVKTDRKCVLCDFAQWFFYYLLFGLGKCSFWLISWQFFPSALKTTKFKNFHRPHSVFPDFQGLEKFIPFFPTIKDHANPAHCCQAAWRPSTCLYLQWGWHYCRATVLVGGLGHLAAV